MKSFTTKPAQEIKPIDFELDGQHYSFSPPKTSAQLVGIMAVRGKGMEADLERAGSMLRWFSFGLNKDHDPNPAKKQAGHDSFVEDCQACAVQAQLDDPTPGSLELETVLEVIAWLIEEASARPTT